MARLLPFIFASLAVVCLGQTTTPVPTDERAVVKLEYRPFPKSPKTGLPRKRFFLIKGSREQNTAFLDLAGKQPFQSRECYYRGIGASEALINWLKESDCESVNCREIEEKYIEGDNQIPEFHNAFTKGLEEFGSRELARQWLPVNLPDNLRSGFYVLRQQQLQALIKNATETTGAQVLSVMTDRNGIAYFTDVEAGNYIVSNLIPTELENAAALWNCDLKVADDDLGTIKTMGIKRQNKKCTIVEPTLPACASRQTASLLK